MLSYAPPRPHKLKGFWYLIKRVPTPYRALDPRSLIRISTGIRIIDDPRAHRARDTVAKLHAGLQQYWSDLKSGKNPNAEKQYSASLETARHMGIAYRPANDVAALPLEEIVRRAEIIDNPATIENPTQVSAALGGQQPPPVMLSRLRETFETIQPAALTRKSEGQRNRWRTSRDTAIATFINVIGADKPVADLTRADVLKLRTHWLDRIAAGKVVPDTANANIGRIAALYDALNETNMLGLADIFRKTNIRGGKQEQRIAYDPAFLQKHFMADAAFATLNREARAIVYILAETGLRPSEACNLDENTIRLDHSIPHVQVRPIGRETKNDQSQRDIPLVGVALMAAKAHPQGFPRYRDNANSLSANVSKYLEKHNLKPVKGQSLYSLRHSFEDRLTAVEAPEKLVASLMGHKWHRPRYGLGPSLEQKASWLRRIAFRPPLEV